LVRQVSQSLSLRLNIRYKALTDALALSEHDLPKTVEPTSGYSNISPPLEGSITVNHTRGQR